MISSGWLRGTPLRCACFARSQCGDHVEVWFQIRIFCDDFGQLDILKPQTACNSRWPTNMFVAV
jgi:hypothetical protein